MGSQQGEQSKSLEAEDGKLCHWKRKTPITGVGCSQHHNLRALLRLHWSPWPPEDQKTLKRNLVCLAELVPFYVTWLQHQEKHQYVDYFHLISKWAEVTPHSPSIFWGVGVWHSLSPSLAQGPCSRVWWRKALRLGGWDLTCVKFVVGLQRDFSVPSSWADWLMAQWSWISQFCDSLKFWQWVPMLGITGANLFLCLNGTMIHQKLLEGAHHDLSALYIWGCDHALVSWVVLVTFLCW